MKKGRKDRHRHTNRRAGTGGLGSLWWKAPMRHCRNAMRLFDVWMEEANLLHPTEQGGRFSQSQNAVSVGKQSQVAVIRMWKQGWWLLYTLSAFALWTRERLCVMSAPPFCFTIPVFWGTESLDIAVVMSTTHMLFTQCFLHSLHIHSWLPPLRTWVFRKLAKNQGFSPQFEPINSLSLEDTMRLYCDVMCIFPSPFWSTNRSIE